MFKIKDNLDLKIFEKYGFNHDRDIWQRIIEDDAIEYIITAEKDCSFLDIDICHKNSQVNEDEYLIMEVNSLSFEFENLLFDLIKQGIIEKVI